MSEKPQIYVKITASFAHLLPPKDQAEAVLRAQSDAHLQAMADRFAKGVAALLTETVESNQVTK